MSFTNNTCRWNALHAAQTDYVQQAAPMDAYSDSEEHAQESTSMSVTDAASLMPVHCSQFRFGIPEVQVIVLAR